MRDAHALCAQLAAARDHVLALRWRTPAAQAEARWLAAELRACAVALLADEPLPDLDAPATVNAVAATLPN